MRQAKRRPGKYLLTLAAVVCVLAALSIAAVATGLFGLRETLLPEKVHVGVIDEEGILIPGETKEVDVISLSGLRDTPESKALAEWQSFLDDYDQDGSIIAQIGNEPTGFESRYNYYLVYTQEMADRLEEIAARYGLKLHQMMELVMPEQWEEVVGPFLLQNNTAYSGYIYEDGTFAYDGGAYLPGYGILDYQFRRSVRGTLHDVILNIEDAAQYQERTYSAAGTGMTLALGSQRGIILADLGDCFVAVNVLAGTETSPSDVFSSGPISMEEMEALADLFDFSVLTPAKAPDLTAFVPPEPDQEAGANEFPAQPEETPKPSEDSLYNMTGIETDDAKYFVWELANLLSEGDREAVANLFVYPVNVTVSDGTFLVETPEELLAYYDEAIGSQLQRLLEVELDYHDIFASDGLVGVGNGAAWFGLVQDSGIRLFTLQNSNDGRGVRAADAEISAG